MKKNCKKWILLFALACLCAGCARRSGGVVIEKGSGTDFGRSNPDTTEEPQKDTVIGVYVCGEVKKPGVYELEPGSRVADALAAAGGATGKAAMDSLNLAGYVEDGQKIKIPSRAEEKRAKRQEAGEPGLLNINEASAQEFMTLSGIGESKAGDIVAYREKHGGFSDISEIMNVAGIKEGIFNRIKDKITT